MSRKNGDWTIHESKQVLKNEFIEVREDAVTQPDGKPGKYATVKMKPGVCILAIDEDDNVYLTKQFRYAIGRTSLEVPCGGLDESEPIAGAKRELREELGIEADDWRELPAFDIDTSIVFSPASIFVARKLKQVEKDEDDTEDIETIKMPLPEAVEKAANGEITHAPSIVALFKFWHSQAKK